MSKSFVVGPGQEFTYPADPISLRTIQDNGGLSKMTDEQRAKLKFKTVSEGQDCSDMPPSSLSVYLERGWVLPKTTVVPEQLSEKVWQDLGRPLDEKGGGD